MEYLDRRREQIETRHQRLRDSGYAGMLVSRADLLLRVPAGWHRLVAALHAGLIVIDPDYLFFDAYERNAELEYECFVASYADRSAADELLQRKRAECLETCEVCAAPAQVRSRTPARTLCDQCFAADRAAAVARGERYANLALLYFMSCDPDHPTADELEAWLDSLRF